METQDKDGHLFTAKDFVYCGVRRGIKGDGFICICPLELDGVKLGEEAQYAVKGIKRQPYIIGGVYRGLLFGQGEKANFVRGLQRERLHYVRAWPENDRVMEWEALHTNALQEEENAKYEREAGKRTEIERVMLPLRKLYNGQFVNPIVQRALEREVVRALRVPLAKGEE